MRLFSAIEIDEGVRADLVGLQRQLKANPGVRWSPPENLHLTLRFYGNWPEERLAELEESLLGVDQPSRVQVDLKRLSFFPNERAPRALVVVVEANDDLLALQERLESESQRLGFKAERRAYSPHITLGRIREPKAAGKLVDAVRAGNWELGAFEASGFALYESETAPTGAIYRKVAGFPSR